MVKASIANKELWASEGDAEIYENRGENEPVR